jgi:hypothetical protein
MNGTTGEVILAGRLTDFRNFDGFGNFEIFTFVHPKNAIINTEVLHRFIRLR